MSFTLIVSNLPEITTESNLQDYFSRAGFSINISTMTFSNNSKNGVAIIEMVSKEERERAISALNGGEFCGSLISLMETNQQRSETNQQRFEIKQRRHRNHDNEEFSDKSNLAFFCNRYGRH